VNAIVLIDSVSRAAGGLFESERRLHQTLLAQQGVQTDVLAIEDAYSSADIPAWAPLRPRVLPVRGSRSVGYSPSLRASLLAAEGDVLYRAGLWSLPSQYAATWSRQHQKPEIITPHGMLDPWAVRNSGWKKRVAHWLYEGKHLRAAACIRALCESEADSIRTFGLKNPIAIIPNGIDLPEDKPAVAPGVDRPWKDFIEPGRKGLLFLSRIHPKKGLINLLRAWNLSAAQSSGWTLVIAGWDQGGHEAELKQLATMLKIPWAEVGDGAKSQSRESNVPPSILFIGPQFNEAKAACYANCDAFILPSFSEGLPMVILEAWAHGKPVLMTPECNLPEGFAANAALRIDANAGSIARALTEMFRASPSALRAFGDRGRALVAGRFTWPKVAADMKSVYDWVLGNGPRPGCVRLN